MVVAEICRNGASVRKRFQVFSCADTTSRMDHCSERENASLGQEIPRIEINIGAIQVLRNADGGGGCHIFWKKALRRCKVQRY